MNPCLMPFAVIAKDLIRMVRLEGQLLPRRRGRVAWRKRNGSFQSCFDPAQEFTEENN